MNADLLTEEEPRGGADADVSAPPRGARALLPGVTRVARASGARALDLLGRVRDRARPTAAPDGGDDEWPEAGGRWDGSPTAQRADAARAYVVANRGWLWPVLLFVPLVVAREHFHDPEWFGARLFPGARWVLLTLATAAVLAGLCLGRMFVQSFTSDGYRPRRWEVRLRIARCSLTVWAALWIPGLGPNAVAFAIIGGCVLVARLRANVAEPDPEPEPEPEQEPEPEPDDEWMARVWRELVAQPGQALPGTVMEGSQQIVDPDTGEPTGAWRGGVQVPRGVMAASAVPAKRELIASAYAVSPSDLSFNVVRGDRVVVVLSPQRVLEDRDPWQPGVSRDGTFRLMDLRDGRPGMWQAYAPGVGGRHGWFCGGTRSGKTRAGQAALASIGSHAVLDLADLKGGSSLPQWHKQEAGYRHATKKQGAHAALLRMNFIITFRSEVLLEEGEEVVDFDRTPLWVTYFAEWPQMHGYGSSTWLLERALQMGAAAGVVAWVDTQASTLQAAFAGSGVAREQFQAGGNVLGLKASSSSASRIFGGNGADIDLSLIPPNSPGTGFLLGPAQDRPGILGDVVRFDNDTLTEAVSHVAANKQNPEDPILPFLDLLEPLLDDPGKHMALTMLLQQDSPDLEADFRDLAVERTVIPVDGTAAAGLVGKQRGKVEAAVLAAVRAAVTEDGQPAALRTSQVEAAAGDLLERDGVARPSNSGVRNALNVLVTEGAVVKTAHGTYQQAAAG